MLDRRRNLAFSYWKARGSHVHREAEVVFELHQVAPLAAVRPESQPYALNVLDMQTRQGRAAEALWS